MQRPEPLDPAVDEIVLSVPATTCRHCVGVISVQVREVPGVVAVEADLTTRTVGVQGTPLPDACSQPSPTAAYEAVTWPAPLLEMEVFSHDREPPHLPERDE